MVITLIIGILIGIVVFLFPIVIGMALFFILVKRLKDEIDKKDEDPS